MASWSTLCGLRQILLGALPDSSLTPMLIMHCLLQLLQEVSCRQPSGLRIKATRESSKTNFRSWVFLNRQRHGGARESRSGFPVAMSLSKESACFTIGTLPMLLCVCKALGTRRRVLFSAQGIHDLDQYLFETCCQSEHQLEQLHFRHWMQRSAWHASLWFEKAPV